MTSYLIFLESQPMFNILFYYFTIIWVVFYSDDRDLSETVEIYFSQKSQELFFCENVLISIRCIPHNFKFQLITFQLSSSSAYQCTAHGLEIVSLCLQLATEQYASFYFIFYHFNQSFHYYCISVINFIHSTSPFFYLWFQVSLAFHFIPCLHLSPMLFLLFLHFLQSPLTSTVSLPNVSIHSSICSFLERT